MRRVARRSGFTLLEVLVVVVILFMPDGLMGFVKKLATRRNREAV